MGHVVVWSGRRAAVSSKLAIVAACALAALFIVAGRSPAPTAVPEIGSSSPQASWAAKGAISDSLGRDQAAFHAVGASGGLIAGNPAQRLTTHFGTRGVLVHSGPTTFGLQLLSYGTAGHTQPIAPAPPRAHANRVTYDHGAVTEWYANGPVGLEQGFDVRTPPAGTGDRLAFVLGLRGNAHARVDGHGGLLLTGPGGERLRYTGLGATDARGHLLGTALTMSGGRALIHVDASGAVYPLRVDPFIQVTKIGESAPGNATNLALTGLSVAGTTAAISVVSDSTTFPNPTAVDIFVANSNPAGERRWELGATRVAQITDPTAGDGFGSSVALSADGRTLAVGAPSSLLGMNTVGRVFVYEEPPGGWANIAPTASLTDNSPFLVNSGQLGKSVSIAPDGSRIAAGAPGYSPANPSVGAVDVFDRGGTSWTSTVTPTATATATTGSSFDALGQAVALSGNTIVAGAIHANNGVGAAYIFQRAAANSWPQKSTLAGEQMGDFFGWATAISADARTIVVTAVNNLQAQGAAYVFTSPNGSWPLNATPVAKLTASNPSPGDQLGESVAIDGNVIFAGAFGTTFNNRPFTGAAFVFVQPPGGWTTAHETQELAASDSSGADRFGQTVAISNGTLFAGAPFASAPGTTNQQGFVYAFGSFPTTGIGSTPAAPDGLNGWFRHPVTLTVSAFDPASPVAAIRCALDPASVPFSFGALPASCAFLVPAGGTVAANGQHALYAAAVNAAGYAATPVSHVFRIDTVGPRVVCTPPPNFSVHGRGGLVTATVSDVTSGPAAPIVAARANVRSAGNKTVTLTGQDNAGNTTVMKCRYNVTAPRVAAGFTFGFTHAGRFTVFTGLAAKKVQRGAKIRVDCKGRGCPFAHRTVKVPTTRLVCKRHHKQCKRKRAPALQNIDLSRLLANRRIAPGSVVTASAFKPNTTRVTTTFTVRLKDVPATTKCLSPGSKKPFSC